jgi:hypothetical protein
MKKSYAAFGFCIGLLAERTTQQIAWLLIASFPLSWGFAGYLFQRWKILQ